jgi:hypothetical protein
MKCCFIYIQAAKHQREKLKVALLYTVSRAVSVSTDKLPATYSAGPGVDFGLQIGYPKVSFR